MQRKASKTTRGENAIEKRVRKFVAGLGKCSACGMYGPIEVHHVVGSAGKKKLLAYGTVIIGMIFLLALCAKCHCMVSRKKKVFYRKYGTQRALFFKQMDQCSFLDEIPEEVMEGINQSGV